MDKKMNNRQRSKLTTQAQEYFRQSVPYEPLYNIRNSFGITSQNPTFRLSDVTSIVFTLSKNKPSCFTNQNLIFQKKTQSSMDSLRSTLHELDIKVLAAKRQLQPNQDSQTKLVSLRMSDLPISCGKKQEDEYLLIQNQFPPVNPEKTHQKLKPLIQKTERIMRNNRVKTFYYISQIAKGRACANARAYAHLKMSLEVLRTNYSHKLQKPKFSLRANIFLPFSQKNIGKKTLVLDMDETLIHCSLNRKNPDDIEISMDIGEPKDKAYISIRPYAISFLKRAKKHFEIIAFTASDRSYADVILDYIDPEKTLIDHRLYREHCVRIAEKVYTKDLKIINRELSEMILVDNSPVSYLCQLDNGVPILPYEGGEDMQLLNLQKYLQQLSKERDVRRLNRATFKLWRYKQFSECETLVQSLYYSQNVYY